MAAKSKILQVALLIALLMSLGCSEDGDKTPTGPPALLKGKISLLNNSGVIIRVLGYSQIRGQQQVNVPLSVNLFPEHSLFLHDMIDGDQGLFFPGGDRITINYVAQVADPDNPSQPLFRNSVELTVNGTYTIQVKNGGEFGIYPG